MKLKIAASVLLILTLSGCGTSRYVKTSAKPWKVLADGCQPIVNGIDPVVDFVCAGKALATTYDNLVNLQHDKDKCAGELSACENISDKQIANYEWKLSRWYRKWYIVAPVSILAGAAAATVLYIWVDKNEK